MSPRVQRAWQLKDTIGPLFSHYGLKNWDLCLARDMVIACPRSLWLTVKAALWAGLGSPGAMQRVWGNSASATGERVLPDDGDIRWNRYAIEELGSITMRRCAGGANEIRITRRGMTSDIYGLGDRSQTDRYRTVLGQLYPGLYREEHF
jgi:hypothetical protein